MYARKGNLSPPFFLSKRVTGGLIRLVITHNICFLLILFANATGVLFLLLEHLPFACERLELRFPFVFLFLI